MLTPDDRATLTNASRIVRAQGDTPLADHFDALVGKLTEPFRPEGADALEAELRALGMLPPITPNFHCGPLTLDFNALSRWANQRQRPIAAPERPTKTPKGRTKGQACPHGHNATCRACNFNDDQPDGLWSARAEPSNLDFHR